MPENESRLLTTPSGTYLFRTINLLRVFVPDFCTATSIRFCKDSTPHEPCHPSKAFRKALIKPSLNILPDLTFLPAIFIKLKSNIERHSQFKLARGPLDNQ